MFKLLEDLPEDDSPPKQQWMPTFLMPIILLIDVMLQLAYQQDINVTFRYWTKLNI